VSHSRDVSRIFGSYSPFALMRQGVDEVERWFERLVGDRRSSSESWTPPVEVFQRGDELVVRLEVPGMTRHDLNVEVADDALTISGDRQAEHQRDRDGLFWSERGYGSFSRTIPLPPGTMTDSARAVFRDGLLEVVLQSPSAEARRGRRIDISGSA
jgi:HSP20 family protein